MIEAIAAVALGIIGLAYVYYRRKWGWVKPPPGPWGLPIVGYLPFMDMKNPPIKQVNELGRRYGDVYTVQWGNFQVLVLQDRESIVDCLRLSETTGRPDTWAKLVMESCGETATMWQQGDKWANNRRITVHSVQMWGTPEGKAKLEELYDIATAYLKDTITSLEGKSYDSMFFLAAYGLAFLEVICYGGHYNPESKLVTGVMDFLMNNSADYREGFTQGSSFWCEYFPLARKFYRKTMKTGVESEQAFSRVSRGKAGTEGFEGMIHDVMRMVKKLKLEGSGKVYADSTEVVTESFTGSMFDVLGAFQFLFLYLAKEKSVQARLQSNLDSIASAFDQKSGPEFWNAIRDEPYLQAVMWECLRLGTPSNGLPHQVMADIHFRGFFIPKGTMIIPNQGAANMDPRLFKDPDQFNPDRFILEDGSFDKAHSNQVMVFSAGKRRCPGENISISFWLTTVALVAMNFDVHETPGFDSLDNIMYYGLHGCSPGTHEISFTRRESQAVLAHSGL